LTNFFGDEFREQVRGMGICEVLCAPRSPWQRDYVERVIGSVRRECLDHMIVLHESSLRRILTSYFDYYHRSRTHLSWGKDSPEPRTIQPPETGPSWWCRRSADCTTATNDGLPEKVRILHTSHSGPLQFASDLCSVDTLASCELCSPASTSATDCLTLVVRLGE
jgi:hypothetical protein